MSSQALHRSPEPPGSPHHEDPSAPLERVGIRELRQNLSKYLERVAEGAAFTVTDRGRPVGVLGPLRREMSRVDRLVAEGKLRPPRLDLRDLPPPLEWNGEMTLSEALAEQRRERL